MVTDAKKCRERAVDRYETPGDDGLAVAVRRALAPRQSRLVRHLLPLALSGSITTIVGCSALPITPLSDTPSAVVVPMEGAVPDERTPPLPEPMATVAALGERRPELIAADPDNPQPEDDTPALPVAGPPPQLFGTDIESEVVGLRLAGSRSWQKLNIQDLDVVVRDPEARFLPLLRILRILNIEHEYDDTTARFHLRGEPEIHIDLVSQTGWIGDRRYDLDLITGTSDITGRPEIYVAAANMQKLLPIFLAWDDINYEYKGTTNHVFAVWDRRDTQRSLLFADADLIGMELPALLDTAQPNKTTLSFLEMQWRSRFADGEAREQLSTVGMEPTAWGHLLGGRYKIALANIEATNHSSGNDVYGGTESWVPNRAEWVYSLPRSEFVVGDSSFGLHDLMFPLTNYSGVRFNGLLGSTESELDKDQSGRGLHRRFYRPHVFEGLAPVGSEVRLELNGDVIATQRILEETDPITGQGVFRFEDIALPSTSVSNIRAVITTEDGVETEIERDMAAAPQLLPPGRIAYVGGFGTNRNSRVWETSGSLFAARALYGLNRRISVGASLAFQNHFFDLTRNLDDDERNLPDQSKHIATEFVATPLSNLTLSGDIAWSLGDDAVTRVDYDGKAMRLRARYFPTDGLQLGSQWFSYSPGYFDGRNRELENRSGYSIDAAWRLSSNWAFRAAAGVVSDIEQPIRVVPTTGVFAQLGGVVLRDPIRTADYGQLQVSTGIMPRTSLTLTLDRNYPSWEGPKTLTSVRSRTRFRNGVNLRIDASFGDNLSPDTDQEYFQGLSLPGFRRFGEDSRFLTLDKKILPRHRVGLEYRGADTVEKMMATHAYEGVRLRLSTKFGWDYEHGDYAWEGWWDYPFNKGGRDRISLVTRFERTDWRADLSVNVVSLFENDRRRVRRLPGDRFNPDKGGVRGRVFVDTNGNGLLDQGERGLSDIEVAGQRNLTAHTDSDGRFYLPVTYGSKEMQVALNLDSVPATYSVVHGRQRARIEPGGATEVNLAVAPLVSVSGAILLEVEQPDADAVAAYQRQLAGVGDNSSVTFGPDSAIGQPVLSKIVPVLPEPTSASAMQPAVAATTETPSEPVAVAQPALDSPVATPELDYSLAAAPASPIVGPGAAVTGDEGNGRLIRELLPEGDGFILRSADAPASLPSIAPVAAPEPEPDTAYSVARETDGDGTGRWETDVTAAMSKPEPDSAARVTAPPPSAAIVPTDIDSNITLEPAPGLAAVGASDYSAVTSVRGTPGLQRATYSDGSGEPVLGEVGLAQQAPSVVGSASTEAIAVARAVDKPLPTPADTTPDAGSASTEAIAVARAADKPLPTPADTTPDAGGAGIEAIAVARAADKLPTPADTTPDAGSASTEAIAVARASDEPLPAPVDIMPDAGGASTVAVAIARVVEQSLLQPQPVDMTPDAGSASTEAVSVARASDEPLPTPGDTTPDAGGAGIEAVTVARVVDKALTEPQPVDATPDAGSASTEAVAVARTADAPPPAPIDTIPDAGGAGTEAVTVARTVDNSLVEPKPFDATPDAGGVSTEAVSVARAAEETLPKPIDTTPDAGGAGTEAIAVASVVDEAVTEPQPVDAIPDAGSASTEAVAVARAADELLPAPFDATPDAGGVSTEAVAVARAADETPPAPIDTTPDAGGANTDAVAVARVVDDAMVEPQLFATTPDSGNAGSVAGTQPETIEATPATGGASTAAMGLAWASSVRAERMDPAALAALQPADAAPESSQPAAKATTILAAESAPASEALSESITAPDRLARAMQLSRTTLLTMSTALTRDAVPRTEEQTRPNPAIQLAMTHRLESTPSFLADPEVRLAETPEPEPALKFSRKIATRTEPAPEPEAKPRKPTRVDLSMARAIEQAPAPRTIVEVAPVEKAIARADSEQTRASGLTMSRALKPVRPGGHAVSGVRVVMRDANDRVVADSVTAQDGSFYLSNLKPGSYKLELDPRTIPEGYIVLEMSKTIEIREAEDFQEIELPPIYAIADLDEASLR